MAGTTINYGPARRNRQSGFRRPTATARPQLSRQQQINRDYPFGTAFANYEGAGAGGGGLTSIGWHSAPGLQRHRQAQAAANTPSGGFPRGGGSGGGGGGGVGGGGGGAAAKPKLSQAGLEAMLAAINRRGQNATWQDYQGPAYQGMDIEAWDPTMYNNLRSSLEQGYSNAGSQIEQGTNYVNNALAQNWNNYGSLRGLAAPVMGQQIGDLMPGVATGGEAETAVMEGNAETAAANAAFQRYLAANELTQSQAQGSRMNEAALANQFYMNQLGQQKLADQTGIGLQESAALQAWKQRQNERAYADNMLRQEWAREQALYNNQGRNTTNAANAAYDQAWRAGQVDPIMNLIAMATEAGLAIDPRWFQ